MSACKKCDGDGYVEVFDDDAMQIVSTYECPDCGGSGDDSDERAIWPRYGTDEADR